MEHFELFIDMINAAISDNNYQQFLQDLIPNKKVIISDKPLKLATIIEICEEKNFRVEVGVDIGEAITLKEYLQEKNISSNTGIIDFCNTLIKEKIMFTNIATDTTVIFYKVPSNYDTTIQLEPLTAWGEIQQ